MSHEAIESFAIQPHNNESSRVESLIPEQLRGNASNLITLLTEYYDYMNIDGVVNGISIINTGSGEELQYADLKESDARLGLDVKSFVPSTYNQQYGKLTDEEIVASNFPQSAKGTIVYRGLIQPEYFIMRLDSSRTAYNDTWVMLSILDGKVKYDFYDRDWLVDPIGSKIDNLENVLWSEHVSASTITADITTSAAYSKGTINPIALTTAITPTKTDLINFSNVPTIGGHGSGLTLDIVVDTGKTVSVFPNKPGQGYRIDDVIEIDILGTTIFTVSDVIASPTNVVKRILEEHDIDKTTDDYLGRISKEIAKGIPEAKNLDRNSLYKKVVEYYNTRGSEASLESFFKIFFDEIASIFYPKEVLFKPSDGIYQGTADESSTLEKYWYKKGFEDYRRIAFYQQGAYSQVNKATYFIDFKFGNNYRKDPTPPAGYNSNQQNAHKYSPLFAASNLHFASANELSLDAGKDGGVSIKIDGSNNLNIAGRFGNHQNDFSKTFNNYVTGVGAFPFQETANLGRQRIRLAITVESTIANGIMTTFDVVKIAMTNSGVTDNGPQSITPTTNGNIDRNDHQMSLYPSMLGYCHNSGSTGTSGEKGLNPDGELYFYQFAFYDRVCTDTELKNYVNAKSLPGLNKIIDIDFNNNGSTNFTNKGRNLIIASALKGFGSASSPIVETNFGLSSSGSSYPRKISWAGTKGFLSDVNKLHDSDYFQEFSYVIRTNLSVDRWDTDYNKLIHPSGLKFFTALYLELESRRAKDSDPLRINVADGVRVWLSAIQQTVAKGQHSPKWQPGWLEYFFNVLLEIILYEKFSAFYKTTQPNFNSKKDTFYDHDSGLRIKQIGDGGIDTNGDSAGFTLKGHTNNAILNSINSLAYEDKYISLDGNGTGIRTGARITKDSEIELSFKLKESGSDKYVAGTKWTGQDGYERELSIKQIDDLPNGQKQVSVLVTDNGVTATAEQKAVDTVFRVVGTQLDSKDEYARGVTFTDRTVARPSTTFDLLSAITISSATNSDFDRAYSASKLGSYRHTDGDSTYVIKKENISEVVTGATHGTWHIARLRADGNTLLSGTNLGTGIFPDLTTQNASGSATLVATSSATTYNYGQVNRGHNIIVFNPTTKTYSAAAYDTYGNSTIESEAAESQLVNHLDNISANEIAIVYTQDASSCRLGNNSQGEPFLREWLKSKGSVQYRNSTTTWSRKRTAQCIVYDKRHNRIFEKSQTVTSSTLTSTLNAQQVSPSLSLRYTTSDKCEHYPFIGTERISIDTPVLTGNPVVIAHPTSGYQKLRINANGAVSEYINGAWVEHRSELEASDPKYLSKIDFTGYDWSPYVTAYNDYAQTGADHGGYDYDEAFGGLVLYGNSQWLEIPLEIPIDEDATYNISLEIENLLPDKTNRVFAGVSSIDDAGNRIFSDEQQIFNYGIAGGVNLTGGQSRTFTANFSGFNPRRADTRIGTAPYSYNKYPVNQTGRSSTKFDPTSTKFRIVLIGHYSPATTNKVEGHVPSTLFKNLKIERADGKPVYNNAILKHDPNFGFNKIANSSLPVVPTPATDSNKTYPNTFAVGTLVKDSKLSGVHSMDIAPEVETNLLKSSSYLPWRPGIGDFNTTANGVTGRWNRTGLNGVSKDDAESVREFRTGPFGDIDVVWAASKNAVEGIRSNGGYKSPIIATQSAIKDYRFIQFFKINEAVDGKLYFGAYPYTSTSSGVRGTVASKRNNTITTNNPYFFSFDLSSLPDGIEVGKWYMAVGYITKADGSNGTYNKNFFKRTEAESLSYNDYSDGGIYSVETKNKISSITIQEFSLGTDTNAVLIRSFLYRAITTGNEIEFARPRIDYLDENNEAPSVHSLLHNNVLPHQLSKYPTNIDVRDIYSTNKSDEEEVKYLITETDKVGISFDRLTSDSPAHNPIPATETSTDYTPLTYNGGIEVLELNNTISLGGDSAQALKATTPRSFRRTGAASRSALVGTISEHTLLTDGQFTITDKDGVDITSSFGSGLELAYRAGIGGSYGQIDLLTDITGFDEYDRFVIPNAEIGNLSGLSDITLIVDTVGNGEINTEHNALASNTHDRPLYLTRDVKFSTNEPVNKGELGAYVSDDFRWESDRAYEISFNATKINDKNIPANLFLSAGKIGKYFPIRRSSPSSCVGNPNADLGGTGHHGTGPHEFKFNSSLEGICRIYLYIGDAEGGYSFAHNGHQLRVDDTNADSISRTRTPVDYYKSTTAVRVVPDQNNQLNNITSESEFYSLYVFESEFLSIGENILQLYNRDSGDGISGSGGFVKVEPLDNGLIVEGANTHKLYIPADENDPKILIDHIVDRDQTRTGNSLAINTAIADLERLYEYNWKLENFKVREKRKRVYQGNFQCIVADAPDAGFIGRTNQHPNFYTEFYRPVDFSSIAATDGATKYGGTLIVPALENRTLDSADVGQEYHSSGNPYLGVPKGKYGALKYIASSSVLHYVSLGDESGGFGIGELYNPGEIYEVTGKIYIPSTNTKLEQIHVMAGINQRATDEISGQYVYDDTGNPLFSNLSGEFQIMTGDLAGYDAYGTEPVVVTEKGNWIPFTHKFIAPSVQQDPRPIVRFVTTLKDNALRGYAGYTGDASGEYFYIKDVNIKEGFDSDIVKGKDEIDERRETIIDLKDNVDYDISLNTLKTNDEACVAIDIKHPADTNFYNVKGDKNTNLGDFDLNALPIIESNLLAGNLPFTVGTGTNNNFEALGNPIAFNSGSNSPFRTTQENVQLEGVTPFGSTDVLWEARNKDGDWAKLSSIFLSGTGYVAGSGYTNGTYTNVEITDSPNDSDAVGVGAKATIVVSGGKPTSITITDGGVNYGKTTAAGVYETANILVKIKAGQTLTTSGTEFIGRANLVSGTINTSSGKVISFADGGFISPQVDVDTRKTYRMSVWVKASDVRYAAGVNPYDTTDGGIKVFRWKGLNDSGATLEAINITSGDEINTPTFIDDFDFGLNSTTTSSPDGNPLNENQWFLVVGHIRPFGHVGTTDHEDSGIYLPSTNPLKVRTLPASTSRGDWKFNSAMTKIQLTVLQNANPLDAEHPVQFYAPRIDEVNGLEPSIEELTSGKAKYKLGADDYEKKIQIINWKTPILNADEAISNYSHIIEGQDFSVTIDEIKNGIEYSDEINGSLISTGAPVETLIEIEIPASGGTNTNMIILPFQKDQSSNGHNISIDWGDGTSNQVDTSRDRDLYHVYTETASPQRFIIKVAGTYHKFNVGAINSSGPSAAVTGITAIQLTAARANFKTHLRKFYLGNSALVQGGSTSASLSLKGCTGLTDFISIKGISNTSNLTNLRTLFENCSSLRHIDVRGLDTTNVTTLNAAFKNIGSGVKLIGFHKLNLSSLSRATVGPEIDFAGTTFNSDELSRCYVSWANNAYFTLPTGTIEDATGTFGVAPTAKSSVFTFDRNQTAAASATFAIDGFRDGYTNTIADLNIGDVLTCTASTWPSGTITITNIDVPNSQITISSAPTGNLSNNVVIKRTYVNGDTKLGVHTITGKSGNSMSSLSTGMVVTSTNANFPTGTVTIVSIGQSAIELSSPLTGDIGNGKSIIFKETTIRLAGAPTGTIVNGMRVTGTGRSGTFKVVDASDQQNPIVDIAVNPVSGNAVTFNDTDTSDIKFTMGSTKYFAGAQYDSPNDTTPTNIVSNARTLLVTAVSGGGKSIEITDGGVESGDFDF